MTRLIVFLIFIFSFTSSWGQQMIDAKKLWAETNYNFDILFSQHLNAQRCYSSEKEFVGCMMAFQKLVLSKGKDKFHHIKVNELNFEIVPLSLEEIPETIEEHMEFNKKKRESFRAFYKTVTNST